MKHLLVKKRHIYAHVYIQSETETVKVFRSALGKSGVNHAATLITTVSLHTHIHLRTHTHT